MPHPVATEFLDSVVGQTIPICISFTGFLDHFFSSFSWVDMGLIILFTSSLVGQKKLRSMNCTLLIYVQNVVPWYVIYCTYIGCASNNYYNLFEGVNLTCGISSSSCRHSFVGMDALDSQVLLMGMRSSATSSRVSCSFRVIRFGKPFPCGATRQPSNLFSPRLSTG